MSGKQWIDGGFTGAAACGVLGWVAAGGVAAAGVTAIDTVTVRDDQLPSQPFYVLDFEDNYLPNVVLRENGAASFEALKAQAVAARSFAYHLIQNTSATFIRNSQADQVYSLGGVQGNPGGLWDQAVRETQGEILTFSDTITAAFYVAGAIPSGPSPVAGPGDPDPTSTEQWVTYTFENGDLGTSNIGTPLGFQGTPTNPNLPNRGAMSQNGADFQSDQGVHYMDILKYYYGGDIQVEQVMTQPGQDLFDRKPLAGFERNNETFNESLTFSGQTQFLDAGTNVTRSQSFATTPGGTSQRLEFDYDAAADTQGLGFLSRHVSGAERALQLGRGVQSGIAQPVGNVILPTMGSIGFSLLVNPGDVDPLANLSVSPVIDTFGDFTVFSSTQQGLTKPVIADGQWHTYEWFLTDEQFTEFLGPAPGSLDDRFSLDSILFEGFGDAVVYFDDVFYDPAGVFVPPPDPGDLDGDGDIDVDDIDLLLANLGTASGATALDGDLDGDFDVDAEDRRILIEDILGTVEGDANLDFAVNTGDLAILASNFVLLSESWSQADFNGDSIVNTADLAILASNFGQSATPPVTAGATAAVPEPGVAGVALGAALSVLMRRRRALR